jgi:hypothetical protein
MTSVDRQALLDKLADGFGRLEVPSLNKQRFVPSQSKVDDMSTRAIGAKLEKALDRRLSKQDALPPAITEKKE